MRARMNGFFHRLEKLEERALAFSEPVLWRVRSVLGKELEKRQRAALAISLALRRAGLEEPAARVARRAKVIAPTVPVAIPLGSRTARFLMYSCGGRDQIAREVWYRGWKSFERPLPQLVAALAEVLSGTFVDVGANTGFYALAASRVNPALQVYCLEPFPPVHQLMLQNLALNGSPPAIYPVAAAAGATSGSADLYVPLQDHGLVETSCSLNGAFKKEHSNVVTVPVTTLDALVREKVIGDLALLKIDVEGHEHAVLAGAAECIGRFRPIVVYEVLPAADFGAIDRFRDEHGYASYRMHPDASIRERQVGFDEQGWNHLMVPVEKVAWVEGFLARVGSPVAS
jgi:FkbM family methyltransferase